jgi:hypothetical protein
VESADDSDETYNCVNGGSEGLRRGDKILSVDGKQTEGRTYTEILHQGMTLSRLIKTISSFLVVSEAHCE